MNDLPEIRLDQIQYNLPDDRIARFPLPQRDASKLLVYKNGQIEHATFTDLPNQLPADSYLVFNNTRVIPARLHFTRATGALIELFLLNPVDPETDAIPPISQAMEATGSVIWQVMIGNRKRWKPNETLETRLPTPQGEVVLRADWFDPEQSLIRFSWEPADRAFAQLIDYAGQIPLPPYLNREATDTDRDTYQTVYSEKDGAVAAPTAGLHFTPAVFDALAQRRIGHDYLTLHVGAGTFQPIKTDDVRQHFMHTEQIVYTKDNLQNLLGQIGHIIPVGTTSMRALESLYWMGVKAMRQDANPFTLDQHYAYRLPADQQPSPNEALQAVLNYMTIHELETVTAHTSIYITPGYQLRLCRGIITNFHQPGSTLILLIAALIGDDWQRVYQTALQQDYRFLSYGDSSLLLP
ncbi:S-adenosylmethionine:tRNA ribosyltransferase-isomerase [Spirosoma rhododendri]|uniref:S-adenosylmethionine:tRNA ribosyltransferase-isomerase n=1 Tax=Spirosoma rhododendri TaxID=2728024 RepID=A0A7L5DN81_9BACT|nr:S-adenosylmethionine:tRNA ribosyltransferase-isomerase [Spirosoma rhododendri]QJD79002.1 S-adenosylmethionine:tRNA ribosyltransferase-isomerase [Spirosoma rhododendri]